MCAQMIPYLLYNNWIVINSLLLRSVLTLGISSNDAWMDEEMDGRLTAHRSAVHKGAFKIPGRAARKSHAGKWTAQRKEWKHFLRFTISTEEWGINLGFYSFCCHCKERAGHLTKGYSWFHSWLLMIVTAALRDLRCPNLRKYSEGIRLLL